jgi:hypothetical protein
MAFHPVEAETIERFGASRIIEAIWDESPLRDLVASAPSTKGSFARTVVEALAAQAGVMFGPIAGSYGSRRGVGSKICEIKFSTEDPARFQQVRPPAGAYDYLIGIGAHPEDLVYWLIPASGVQDLIDEGEISYQHADTSLWFFPETTGPDAFSKYRLDAMGMIEQLQTFA